MTPTVEVVIPLYNEERDITPSITTLREYLQTHCPYQWRIVIADNASTDRTPELGRALAARWPEVKYVRLEKKGRGRALRRVWLDSEADLLSYMDVDLSTNLRAFLPLLEPLARGEREIAIGSRLKRGASVTRQWKREIISRLYNLIIAIMFPRRKFSDAQCGFKALTRKAAQELLPLVVDQGWFFDSELLLRAEQRGYTIHEVAVEWIEDLDSRVKIWSTAWDDLKGLWRVRWTPHPAPMNIES